MTDHTTSVDITSVDSVFDVIVIGAGPVGENYARTRQLPDAREAVTGAVDSTAVLRRRDGFASHWTDDGQVSWLGQAGITPYRGQGRIDGPRSGRVGHDATTTTSSAQGSRCTSPHPFSGIDHASR